MRWSIPAQLLLPVLLLLMGVGGISFWTARNATLQARRQIEDRLRNVARVLEDESNWALTPNVLQWMKRLSGAEYVLVSHKSDEPTVSSLELEGIDLDPTGPVMEDWRDLHLGARLQIEGRSYLCSGLKLTRRSNKGDILYILYPESLWRDARREAIWPSLILGGSVGLASLLLAVAQGRALGRRLRQLERRTRLIAGGDFSPMPLPVRRDEIRELAIGVNEMAQQLAQFQKTVQETERLRLLAQISGGLAHQLRNGLTGARLAVQLHLRESGEPAGDGPLFVALRQLALMEAQLKRLLDVGKADATAGQRCLLTALVGDALELLRPQCRHAGIALEWDAPRDQGAVLGDRGHLEQLIHNLAGNAIDAAGPGGRVAVLLRREESSVILELCDSGPGPPAAIADRLFEPFVTGKPEGVGLGLAVCRQIVDRHGGRIGWRREDGRTCFRVELPAV